MKNKKMIGAYCVLLLTTISNAETSTEFSKEQLKEQLKKQQNLSYNFLAELRGNMRLRELLKNSEFMAKMREYFNDFDKQNEALTATITALNLLSLGAGDFSPLYRRIGEIAQKYPNNFTVFRSLLVQQIENVLRIRALINPINFGSQSDVKEAYLKASDSFFNALGLPTESIESAIDSIIADKGQAIEQAYALLSVAQATEQPIETIIEDTLEIPVAPPAPEFIPADQPSETVESLREQLEQEIAKRAEKKEKTRSPFTERLKELLKRLRISPYQQ